MTQKLWPSELYLDGVVHVLGVALTIGAAVLVIPHAADMHTTPLVLSLVIYISIVMCSFVVSGVYNLWPWDHYREQLRRVDHAVIYLKIAGSYTPMAVLIGTTFAYMVLGFIWGIAICGIIGKLLVARWPYGLNTALTLSLGWASIVLLFPLARTLPETALWLVCAGGGFYTVGTVFYLWDRLRFHTAIWHCFVLAGTGSILAAISIAVT